MSAARLRLEKNGPIEKQIQLAVNVARDYMADNRVSQSRMATELKVAPSTFSEFLNGTYSGKVEDIAKTVLRFVGERAPVVADGDGSIPIKNYNRIQSLLRRTKNEEEFSVIIGDPGLGKTTAVRSWVRQDPDAVYIRITGVSTKGSLLKEIARKMGQLTTHDNNAANYAIVRAAIQEQARLIIVDEADRLSIPMLELLRDIYDAGNCSMVMIGLERFLVILKSGRSLRENLAQLYRRVGYMRKLEHLDLADVQLVLEHSGIKRVGADCTKWIVERIRNSGGIGVLSKVIRHSLRLAEKSGTTVNDQIIKSSFQYLVKGIDQ